MFGGFVHPALAIGALLAAVPLIIHLMNRQRHKPMPWAAMRFVLAAYKKTRRQVQLENLLLLLLRMAAVALLAFAVARPFASGESPLSRLTEERQDLAIVLDASASTAYRSEVETSFERIALRARDLIGELEGGRGDRVRLILAGESPRLLSWTTPEAALSILATVEEPRHESLDLAAALAEVRTHAEKDAAGTGQSTLSVLLLTDMQRRSFEGDFEAEVDPDSEADDAPTVRGALAEELDALDALGVRVLVEDLGPAETTPSNLAIRSILPPDRMLGAGVPQEVRVVVANFGAARRSSVRVALEVDGNRLPSRRVDVEGRGEASCVFTVKFDSAGPHALVASLEGDNLGLDDTRAEVVQVPPALRVLVVNGEPKQRLVDDETGYLMALLEPVDDASLPGSGVPTLFEPREILVPTLSDPELELAGFDLIVLANVQGLAEGVAERLEEAVAAGSALVVFLGGRVDLDDYNEKLYRADGTGLLPAELERVKQAANPREAYYRVGWFDDAHPAVDFFADDRYRPLLTEVPISGFVRVRPLEVADVYARLDDEDQSPLMLERTYDRGRVVLWTTTVDRAWSRIPDSPRTFLPLMHMLFAHAGRRATDQRNHAPGSDVALEVLAFPRDAELVRPDGSRRTIDGEATRTRGDLWALPVIPAADTARVGLYRVERAGGRPEPFAVRLDPREGDLERLSPAELGAIHSALVPHERADESRVEAGPRQGELWRILALACVIALVAETLWAAWLGSKRRIHA